MKHFIRKGRGGFMYIRNEVSGRKMSVKERRLLEIAEKINSISVSGNGMVIDQLRQLFVAPK